MKHDPAILAASQPNTLSIIMPCFNMADTLPRALDSILMQQTDFTYDVLVVDDGSTDNTIEIVNAYAEKHSQIHLIHHQENQGNTGAFYSGLCAAQSDFFCVLEGDDYYTHREKLQRQIDFFRGDILQEYVAAAHYYVLDLCDGSLRIEKRGAASEFTYIDFLTKPVGYYHISTYMYRHIFKGNVPEYFAEDCFRGDTTLTYFHLQASGKKVKVLDFAGSAYVYSNKDIWPGMTKRKQIERNISFFKNLYRVSNSEYEIKCYEDTIQSYVKDLEALDDSQTFLTADTDYYLDELTKYTRIVSFTKLNRDFVLRGVYYSQYVDSLCATLGYINGVYHPECIQKEANADHIAIITRLLTPRGGGIFREIVELIEIYENKKVMLLLTNVDEENVSGEAREILGAYPNICIKAAPAGCPEKLVWLSRTMAAHAPYKAYYYAPHDAPYAQALMQNGVCKNICLFSFDHGYICGISNPNFDCIIAKRPVDYELLRKRLGEKVIYIPTWCSEPKDCDGLQYKPFSGHTNLVTAGGAARFYKVKNTSYSSYLENVLELLCITKGKHIHFGPLPQEDLGYIQAYLRAHGLPQESFIHIEWSDNMPKDMLENHVDIFIEPFPVVSYKMTLAVLSVGIPVIAQDNKRRIGKMDFIYPDNLIWKTKRNFLETLSGLTAAQLEAHSRRSLEYFESTHSKDVIRPYLLYEKPFPLSQAVEVMDNVLTEIRPYEEMYGQKGALNLLDNKEQAQTAQQAVNQSHIQASSAKRKLKNFCVRHITKKNIFSLCLLSLLCTFVGLQFLNAEFFNVSEMIGEGFIILGLSSFLATAFLIFIKLALKIYIHIKSRK